MEHSAHFNLFRSLRALHSQNSTRNQTAECEIKYFIDNFRPCSIVGEAKPTREDESSYKNSSQATLLQVLTHRITINMFIKARDWTKERYKEIFMIQQQICFFVFTHRSL